MIINRNGKQNNIHDRNSSNSVTSGHTCACNTVEPMTHSYWSFCHFCIVCDNLREEGSRDRPLNTVVGCSTLHPCWLGLYLVIWAYEGEGVSGFKPSK